MTLEKVDSSSLNVSIVIVSYNTKDMTCECIHSVYDQAEVDNFEVIVVDNNSSDGSAEAIAERFPKVELLRSKDNLGFARANNLAVERARGNYVLLLNPDTLVLDHAIDKLLRFAEENSHAKVWGGKTLYADRSLNPTSCWRFMSLWSLLCQSVGLTKLLPGSQLFNQEAYGNWNRGNERHVDIVTGCFLLISRDFWNELDGFDTSFFMYAEEADLCFRATKLGAKPKFTPNATIVHYDGASEKVFAPRAIRMLSGRAHFVRKHWSGPRLYLGITFLKLGVFIRLCAAIASAVFTKKRDSKRASYEWLEVWKARKNWQLGYGGRGI